MAQAPTENIPAGTLTGTLQGKTITLDVIGSLPEGRHNEQRVRVILEPLDDAAIQLSSEQQLHLLKDWAEHGPQGPVGRD